MREDPARIPEPDGLRGEAEFRLGKQRDDLFRGGRQLQHSLAQSQGRAADQGDLIVDRQRREGLLGGALVAAGELQDLPGLGDD